MNQNFSFMEFLKPLILDGTKIYTTRLETAFRLKCDVNDIMHQFTGLRTEKACKFVDAKVVNRWRWNQSILINTINKLNGNELCLDLIGNSPIDCTWTEFSKGEGFNSITDYVKWFTQKRYLNQDLITYQFEVTEVIKNGCERREN